MIVLSRKCNETVQIGDKIEVTLVDIRADTARIGINAPAGILVHRKEVYDAIRRENAAADRINATSSLRSRRSDSSIRLATELDLSTINQIYNHYVVNSTATYQEQEEPLDSRAEWFARHGVKHPVIVAVHEGRVVGWGSLSPFHSRSAFRKTVESSVYVDHRFHRQGVGTALLQDLIIRAGQAGHHCMIAAIDSEQMPSLELHERLGFVKVAHMREVGFKFGRWLDVIDMQLML